MLQHWHQPASTGISPQAEAEDSASDPEPWHDHACMPHSHHDHAHDHGQGRHDRAFAIGTALNVGFIAAEVVFGLAANSMALLADAAHNLGDVVGLLLGWGATWLARLPPTPAHIWLG